MLKTERKECSVQDTVITKPRKGAYRRRDTDGKGNKLTTLLNQEKALAATSAGIAKQGWQ
jgi:hypothetical protein